jgi:Cu(I)/Ag(I) efflux system membrane fusion protein
VVWVETKPGVFLPRDVTTGARSGSDIQILSGLKAGEKVAITGSYLIDSEAQLSHGANRQAQPSAAPVKSGPTPLGKKELDMNDMKMP